MQLDMAPYCSTAFDAPEAKSLEDAKTANLYDLNGIVVHTGTIQFACDSY
jgi:hypothetical protein